jgi:hypothetical protein
VDGTSFAVIERLHIHERDETTGHVREVHVYARHPTRGLLLLEKIYND